ncbi:MAG: hypothetical protein J7604_26095, partial [Sporocytophaga sp.]|uniref:beta strand repeat-containing protein n=1 Tax=Sporocytophaga sp. TaxID=2231183 RepID=UPI001B1D9466
MNSLNRLSFWSNSEQLTFRILTLLFLLIAWTGAYADSFTWKANSTNNTWEDPANWTPTNPTNAQVPVDANNKVVFRSSDNITIVASTNNHAPELNSNQTIGTFTVTSGIFTISSGFTLNVTGSASIAGGTIIDGSGEIALGSVTSYNLTVGGATINCAISGNVSSLYLLNNIFGSMSSISLKVSNSTGYYKIGGNTFNGPVTLESNGNSGIRLSDLAEDRFNNDLTLISTTGLIYASYNYSTIFNGNIVVKSTGLGVYFGNSASNSLITSTLTSGKTIKASSFTLGVLTLKNFIQQGASTPQVLDLGGSADCVFTSGNGVVSPQTIFESVITVSSPIIHLNGGRFKESATFNATSTATSTGGNIYEKSSIFNFNNITPNGYWTFNGTDQYLGETAFINSNVGTIYLGNSTGTNTATFAGNVTCDNKSTGAIVLAYATGATVNFTNPAAKVKFIARSGSVRMAENGTTNIDCNVEVNSNGGTIYTVNGTGKTYLKSGRTIRVGEDLGFSQGTLDIKNFIQEGTTSQSLLLPCDGSNNNIYMRSGCDFSGNLTLEARQVLLQGGIYRGTTDISMCYSGAGAINNTNTEPISFKGDAYIRNKGVANMMLGYGTPVITFEGNTYFYITGTGNITLSSGAGSKTVFENPDKKVSVSISSVNNATAGSFYFSQYGLCEIQSDVELSNNANANIVFGTLSTGTATLADGKSIRIIPGTFTYGNIYFRKFTQYGNALQDIVLEGTSMVWFDPGSIFNGKLNVSASRIILYGGSIFNDTCFFEKTGGTIDNWNGGNEFHKKVTVKSSGSSYVLTGYSGTVDHFYDDVTFWNASSGGMFVSQNVNTQFDGNIHCKNTGTGSISFGNGGGSSTLANGKEISTEGFTSSGGLSIKHFKQLDPSASQEIILSSEGTGYLTLGEGVEFNGQITVSAPNFGLGGIYRGISSFTKSGIGNSASNPNSYFETDVTFTNSNNGGLYIGKTNWTFNGNVTFENLGASGSIIISNGSDTTNFNGIDKLVKFKNASSGGIIIANYGVCNFNSNIELSNTSTGAIQFCTAGAANGANVNLSSNSHLTSVGFNSGILNFKATRQTAGSPDFILDLSGAKLFIDEKNEFYSNFKITSSTLSLKSSIFHSSVEFLVKNDIAGNNSSSFGGSIFYSDFTATNEGPQGLGLVNDIYMGNATFIKKSTGSLNPSYSGTSEFYGDVIYNVSPGQTPNSFGGNGGITVFKGEQPQTIKCNYGVLGFGSGGIQINKSNNHVTMNTSLSISSPITFVKGNFITTPDYYFRINNPVNITGASNQSYVEGKVRRVGAGAFTFPIGKNGRYRPVIISDPVSASSDIYMEYFNLSPSGSAFTSPVMDVSECEYWNINAVTANPFSVTLSWDADACTPINPNVISVAR